MKAKYAHNKKRPEQNQGTQERDPILWWTFYFWVKGEGVLQEVGDWFKDGIGISWREGQEIKKMVDKEESCQFSNFNYGDDYKSFFRFSVMNLWINFQQSYSLLCLIPNKIFSWTLEHHFLTLRLPTFSERSLEIHGVTSRFLEDWWRIDFYCL